MDDEYSLLNKTHQVSIELERISESIVCEQVNSRRRTQAASILQLKKKALELKLRDMGAKNGKESDTSNVGNRQENESELIRKSYQVNSVQSTQLRPYVVPEPAPSSSTEYSRMTKSKSEKQSDSSSSDIIVKCTVDEDTSSRDSSETIEFVLDDLHSELNDMKAVQKENSECVSSSNGSKNTASANVAAATSTSRPFADIELAYCSTPKASGSHSCLANPNHTNGNLECHLINIAIFDKIVW